MSGSFREGDISRINAGDIVHSNGEFVGQGHRIGGARLLVDGLLDREDETTRSDRAGLKLLAPELKARVIRRAVQQIAVDLGDETARIGQVGIRQEGIDSNRF